MFFFYFKWTIKLNTEIDIYLKKYGNITDISIYYGKIITKIFGLKY